jgi:hypothetical protein
LENLCGGISLSGYDTAFNITSLVQVYRISKGWKAIFAICLLLLMVPFGYLMAMPFLDDHSTRTILNVFSFIAGLAAILFLFYAVLSLFKSRIEIDSEKIRYVGVFKTTELLIKEIKGFRILPTQYVRILVLLPINPKAKKIETALVLERQSDLFEWLNQNLTNLDLVDSENEMNRILDDARFGETKEQRRYVLDRAKMWPKILNGLGVFLMLWVIFRPHPYHYAIWAAIALPLVALGFVGHFHGALKFDKEGASTFPNIALAFMMPCVGLVLRASTDFNILSWNNFWPPFAGISLSIYSLTLLVAKDVRRRYSIAIALILFCATYGYGTVICLNGILDTSPPSVYNSQVIEKRVSNGRHTSYYLKLSAWGTRKEEKEVDVGKFVYDRRGIGDSVGVVVRNGRLGIPWFYVR